MSGLGGEEMEKRVKREIEKFYKKALKDSGIPQPAQEVLQAIAQSHARQGSMYRIQGRLRDAIEEYRKDTELEITGYAEAIVAEVAFCDIGDIYMELGEIENAVAAYENALDLWQQYHYGRVPHDALAKAYLEEGRVDHAINVCREGLEWSRSEGIEKVLIEAETRKQADDQEGASCRSSDHHPA
jgi:tetratricopeptide (TPR) repeat protein